MKLKIDWTDDCQGKKDYDGALVDVSTRYWPGPATVFNTAEPEKGLHQIGDHAPSANCTIRFCGGGFDSNIVLAEKQFEGDSFESVASQVEQWAESVSNRIIKALSNEFNITT